jgi:hypothetical protein
MQKERISIFKEYVHSQLSFTYPNKLQQVAALLDVKTGCSNPLGSALTNNKRKCQHNTTIKKKAI